jgi:hypothetical protein
VNSGWVLPYPGYVITSGSSGGGGIWGTITGTLSDQDDLQDALDLKVDYSAFTATTILSRWTISGNSSNTGFTIQHDCNQQFVMVEIVETVTPYGTIYADVQRTNTNCVCVIFDDPPATGTCYKILIMG